MMPEMRSNEPLQNPQGLGAFTLPKTGDQLAFSDIDTKSWYYQSLLSLVRRGLVSHTATTFAPSEPVTRAQAAAMAVRLYERYHGMGICERTEWFPDYTTIAQQYNLLDTTWSDVDLPITRAEIADLFCRIMPQELKPINDVQSISDLPSESPYYTSVRAMMQAGILSGTSSVTRFEPQSSISRAEFIVMTERLLTPGARKSSRRIFRR